jgi:hypothetical protein
MKSSPQSQRHPQESRDRQVLDELQNSSPEEKKSLAELARLRIRYKGFPGATEIKADLDLLLSQWGLTEDELFRRTREIHSQERIYQVKGKRIQQEQKDDWT